MTFDELDRVDPGRWLPVAAAFRTLGEAVADRAEELARAAAALGPYWAGTAAATAIATLLGWQAALAAAYPALVGIDQALSEFTVAVEMAQEALRIAARPAAGSAVRVDSSGIVTARPDVQAAPVAIFATTAAIQAAIAAADAADRDAAHRIGATDFDPPAATGGAPVPAAGTDPATVVAWWADLSPAQQRYLIAERPTAIEALDGVPIDARDQAARILLHQLPIVPPAIATRLAEPSAARAYLVKLDAADGRAIVSIGDPDRSPDVLTFVPGVGAGLGDIASTMAAADNLRAAAGPELSTIDWVDYGAPPTVIAAAGRAPARHAAAGLARFDAGLRDTHTGPAGHDTIVGYSYGSTVVGVTASASGLHDNDIVLVGSPGVGVDSARDLGIDTGHVWATTATDDAIRLAVDPTATIVGGLAGHPSGHLWFGTDPTAPAFGARVFASDSGSILHPIKAHESYFTAGSRALTTIATIATNP